MFQQLGKLSAGNPWTVCLLWLLAGIGLAYVAPAWDTRTQDDDIRFLPGRFTSVRAYHLLEQAFPQDVFASRLVFAVEREEQVLTDADFALVDTIVADLEKLKQDEPQLKLAKIDHYKDAIVGSRLTSVDGKCTLIQVSLATPYLAVGTMNAVERAQTIVNQRVEASSDHPPQIYATGAAGIGRDLTKVCGACLEGTTIATIILVIVVLMLVYRAPLLALVPLATIALSVWAALNGLAIMTMLPGVHLVNISKIFAVVILYGAGTDYCLFLISRYREELAEGFDVEEALARSVGGVGEALAASAGTVIVGLGLMALAEFAKVRYAGPAIALSLCVALAASLTLTPALLSILGKVVFWPRPAPALEMPRVFAGSRRQEKESVWDSISHVVARNPLQVWIASMVILAPLVYLGLQVKPNYKATGELSPECESLKGLAAIQRHFIAGEVGPLTVLVSSSSDWNTVEGGMEIDHLTRGLARLENVVEVRSMTRPLGFSLPHFPAIQDQQTFIQRLYMTVQPALHNLTTQIQAHAQHHYVAKVRSEGEEGPTFVTRLDIVMKTDPFEAPSIETMKLIQTWLDKEMPLYPDTNKNVQWACYGITATSQDLAEVTEGDRLRINSMVLVAIFLILVVLVRKIWLAAYLLVTVLASYFAALGATVLAGIFWTGAPLEHVEWRVPFFLFTILVAVGEDYNILLVNRALEEKKRHGGAEGMRQALAKTGGAITSCGIIMAGTFATLMLSGLGTLLQIGFALAFGVLVDTFLVRPFLVPAFAILCWRTAEADAQPASTPEDWNANELREALEEIEQAA